MDGPCDPLGTSHRMPWWYGAAQWQAQWWVVVGGIALAVTTWLSTLLSPRRTGGYVHLSLIMVGFLAWTAIALLPMPPSIASQLSGAQRFVKSIVASAEVTSEQTWLRPESYNTVSVSPTQTQASIACWPSRLSLSGQPALYSSASYMS